MPAYKNTSNNTWFIQFRYKDWTGKTKAITKRGFTTKREAVQWEENFRLRQAGNLDMTFAEFTKLYKEERSPRLKQSTQGTKDNVIDTKLVPYFGNKRISEITSSDIIKWQNELLRYRAPKSGKAYSPVYLKTIHNQLSAIFNHAVRYYGLQKNPAAVAGNMGSERRGEMNFWTREEYLRFAEEIMDSPQAFYCFEVLYWCGIREGELLALAKDDFDLEKRELSITKTYHRAKGEDIITAPKTPKSRRTVSMPAFLCEEMQDYFQMCYDCSPTDRVFPVSKSFLTKNLRKGAERAGLPAIRVHDLRHSHVSLLIDLGYSAVAIADRMGHESIDITYRYAHLFPSVQTQMASQLDALRGENHVT